MALPLFLQVLCLTAGVELKANPTELDRQSHADDQAASFMRSESQAARSVGPHKSIQFMDSGAMRYVKKQRREKSNPLLTSEETGRAGRWPMLPRHELRAGRVAQLDKEETKPASPLSDKTKIVGLDKTKVQSGFQDVADDIRSADLGTEWKEDRSSKEESTDDDWDDEYDESSRGTVQDPYDSSPSNGTQSDSVYGDDADDDGSAYDASDMPMVNVTAEEDATAPKDTGPLKALEVAAPLRVQPENDMEKLGEGIGAMAYERSPTGSRSVNQELRKRLQLQDFATVILLGVAFFATIILSCCSVYQVADDPSPAAYYSEPKNYQQRVICETNDAQSFLTAFNTQPQNVRLRITGKNPNPGGFRGFLRTMNAHTTRPRGLAALLPMRQRRRLSVLFDVSLDLAPFITNDGRVTDDNLATLEKYLATRNPLEAVRIEKRVDWPEWEDVATNIRQRLRTLGFPGDVDVRFEAQDEILIYQNHKWSNFVRNRVTQALVVISIFGSVFWLPYVWARSKTTKVETRFRITVDPNRYWELVQDGLSAAEGFQSM